MTLFGISSILVFVTNVAMGTFVYLQGPEKKLNKTWLALTISIAFWGLFSFIATRTPNYNLAMMWWKISYIPVILVPVFFFHFVCVFLKYSKHILIKFFYGMAVLFILINLFLEKMFLGGINFVFNSLYWFGPPGILYPIFYISFYVCMTLYAFILLFKKLKTSFGPERTQLIYLMIGTGIGWVGAEGLFPIGWNIQIYPITNFLVALYTIIIGYAIVKHQLLEIQLIIRKTLAYSVIISIVTTLYLVAIFISEKVFSTIIGYQSVPLAVIIITLFSILFIPFRNKIQHLIDKYFFHGSIDQIDEENIKLREELQKSEKLKAVATLAAGMAHEIKNPLTSIKTFTEFVDQKKDDPEFTSKFKKIVGGEVDRINHIVQQLLEFSKPSELQLKETDINGLLDDTLHLLSNDLVKHNIKIEKQYANQLQAIIDPHQMKQVFLNLFLNAKDAMKAGGTITITTEQEDNNISIRIADTGIGINKEDRKHIFDPFFTKKDTGTGLGLSVVHGIIEKHGGKIATTSTLNKGTEFKLILPTYNICKGN